MSDSILDVGLEELEKHLESMTARVKELRGHVNPDMAPTKTPGERLALARNRARLSQNALSELSGVSVNAIINFENGRTKPRPRTLMALAEHVDIPWETLKEDDDGASDAEEVHTHEG